MRRITVFIIAAFLAGFALNAAGNGAPRPPDRGLPGDKRSTLSSAVLKLAEARLEQAKAMEKNARAKAEVCKATAERIKADLQSLKVAASFAKKKYERVKSLLQTHAVSQHEFDKTEMEWLTIRAKLSSAEAALKETEANLRVAETEIAVAVANVSVAEAKIAKIKAELKDAPREPLRRNEPGWGPGNDDVF